MPVETTHSNRNSTSQACNVGSRLLASIEKLHDDIVAQPKLQMRRYRHLNWHNAPRGGRSRMTAARHSPAITFNRSQSATEQTDLN
jgi:hypothetical protein